MHFLVTITPTHEAANALDAGPGGPGPLFFRLAITSQHTQAQIDRLIAALSAHLAPAVPVKAAG